MDSPFSFNKKYIKNKMNIRARAVCKEPSQAASSETLFILYPPVGLGLGRGSGHSCELLQGDVGNLFVLFLQPSSRQFYQHNQFK